MEPLRLSFGKVLALMALYVLLGIPLVAYLWETINELLAFDVNPVRLLIAVPVLLLFLGLLILLNRLVRRWGTSH